MEYTTSLTPTGNEVTTWAVPEFAHGDSAECHASPRPTCGCPMQITFSPAEVTMIEALNTLRHNTNALPGGHAYEGKTYGAITEALLVAITTAIHDAHPIGWGEAKDIARLLYNQAADNGENISYQVALFNKGIIA